MVKDLPTEILYILDKLFKILDIYYYKPPYCMKQVRRLTESDLNRLAKKIIKEEENEKMSLLKITDQCELSLPSQI